MVTWPPHMAMFAIRLLPKWSRPSACLFGPLFTMGSQGARPATFRPPESVREVLYGWLRLCAQPVTIVLADSLPVTVARPCDLPERPVIFSPMTAGSTLIKALARCARRHFPPART
jgi:hypothetical protein